MSSEDKIAERLRALREYQGISQALIADALDISISGVSRRESGQVSPRQEQLLCWVKALGYRMKVVLFRPLPVGPIPRGEELTDDECNEILSEIAAALPHMPRAARRLLLDQAFRWAGDLADEGLENLEPNEWVNQKRAFLQRRRPGRAALA